MRCSRGLEVDIDVECAAPCARRPGTLRRVMVISALRQSSSTLSLLLPLWCRQANGLPGWHRG